MFQSLRNRNDLKKWANITLCQLVFHSRLIFWLHPSNRNEYYSLGDMVLLWHIQYVIWHYHKSTIMLSMTWAIVYGLTDSFILLTLRSLASLICVWSWLKKTAKVIRHSFRVIVGGKQNKGCKRAPVLNPDIIFADYSYFWDDKVLHGYVCSPTIFLVNTRYCTVQLLEKYVCFRL